MLQNYTVWSVASAFFKEPTKEHYLKGISREINLAHTSVKKILNYLERLSIIKRKDIIRNTRIFPVYKANINSNEYRKYKILYAVDSIQELADYLNDKIMPESIVLFGSYAKGEDTEESDVDIFIEAKEKKLNLTKFEKKLGRKIELHFKSKFTEYSKELKNNISNGFVLRGYLDVYSDDNKRKRQRKSRSVKKNGRDNSSKTKRNKRR